MSRLCAHCATPFEASLRGRPRRYCSRACQQAAHRVRVLARGRIEIPEEPISPVRTIGDAHTLLLSEAELLEHGAEVLRRVTEVERVEAEQMAEAERTGRTVWRYIDEEENDLRESAQAFREFHRPIEVWVDFD